MICAAPPSLLEQIEVERAAVQLSKKWVDRKTLRVSFLEGDPALQAYVAREATGLRSWNYCSALQLVFTDDPNAEIRIAFQPGVSWSQLGTDSLYVGQGQPTCNLSIRIENAGPHIDRVIHHELGHARGYVHGHQVPGIGDLNEEAVYAWYRARGYDDGWILSNVIQRYPRSDVQGILKRFPSVMDYWMPGELWADGVPMEAVPYPTYWDAVADAMIYGDPPHPITHVYLPNIGRSA